MSPRVADPAVADALVETGARLIAEREPLTTRRLATEVGTSTSAVYTHFGSMEELRRAIRREGFARLAEYLTRIEPSDDPVADLIRQGWSYCRNATTNPNMYRAMFMEAPVDKSDAEVGLYTFQMLVDAVQRSIDARRFDGDDAWEMGLRLWAATHGAVALHLSGTIDAQRLDQLTLELARALFVSFGDDPEKVEDSLGRAAEWIVSQLAS